MPSLRLLLLIATAACSSAPPVAASKPGTAAPAAPRTLERIAVTADDGFQLTMWRKAPAAWAPEPSAPGRSDTSRCPTLPERQSLHGAGCPRRVVLLIHGRTWSARPDFDLQVPGESRSFMDALVAAGYVAYALDLRGYGATPRDATGFLTPERAAADVAAALRMIGDRPVLFGWSLGAMVSQLTTQRSPDLVGALVLFGYPTDPDRTPAPAEDPELPPRRPTTAEAAAEDFIAPNVISQRAIAAYVQAALAADPVRMDWRRTAEWAALAPEAVRVPTLLIQAELDPLARTDAHARLFARLATADRQWVVIPGGDHAALLEDTAPRLIAAIRAFVERPGE
jgi:pimeloyl-ACP methyl ester carboxylesterase